MDIAKILSKEENLIDSPELQINGNILSFKDYFLLISNVSQASIAPVRKRSYPIPALVVLILLGLSLLGMYGLVPKMVALILLGVSGYIIYDVYKKNSNLGGCLILRMNSGGTFWFSCDDRAFLNKVMTVLQNCANNLSSNVSINFRDSVVTMGDQNQVTVEP